MVMSYFFSSRLMTFGVLKSHFVELSWTLIITLYGFHYSDFHTI